MISPNCKSETHPKKKIENVHETFLYQNVKKINISRYLLCCTKELNTLFYVYTKKNY